MYLYSKIVYLKHQYSQKSLYMKFYKYLDTNYISF